MFFVMRNDALNNTLIFPSERYIVLKGIVSRDLFLNFNANWAEWEGKENEYFRFIVDAIFMICFGISFNIAKLN